MAVTPSAEVDIMNRVLDSDAPENVRVFISVGMSLEEIADTLHISIKTAHSDWHSAWAWLLREMRGDNPDADA